jgi:diguanylate cyclase (GGDEF)-like protein/PAS domain S-box-containing protein
MDAPDCDLITLETFRSIVEESLIGVYLIQDERFVYVNPQLGEIFGYTREELLELRSVLRLIDYSHRELVKEKLRQRIAGEIAVLEYVVRGVRKDGRVIDLEVRSARTHHHGAPAVMGSMLDITERKQLEEALRNLSLTDDLTGLYNRRGFSTLAERHLTLARRKNRELLLIFADLDGLKQINDTHGHLTGDQAVVDAANILRSTYRKADIISRLGGDEFSVFPIEAGPDTANLMLQRLEDNIERHNSKHERPYTLSLTVGVGRFDPVECQTVQQLLAEADRELYRRKRERGR